MYHITRYSRKCWPVRVDSTKFEIVAFVMCWLYNNFQADWAEYYGVEYEDQ